MVSIFGTENDARSAAGTSGAQAGTGDPTSITVSAGDDQNADISVTNNYEITSTDAGAFDFGERVAGLSVDALDQVLGFGDELLFFFSDLFTANQDQGRAVADAAAIAAESNEKVSAIAIDAVAGTLNESLVTAENINSNALDFGEEALDIVDRASDRSFQLVEDTAYLIAEGQEEVFNFGNDVVTGAFDTVGEAAILVADSQDRAFDFGDDALRTVDVVTSESINAVSDANAFIAAASDRALDSVDQVQVESFNFAQSVFDQALETIGDSQEAGFAASQKALTEINRDASERTSQTILYVAGGVAAAAILGAIFVGKS